MLRSKKPTAPPIGYVETIAQSIARQMLLPRGVL